MNSNLFILTERSKYMNNHNYSYIQSSDYVNPFCVLKVKCKKNATRLKVAVFPEF